MPQRVVLDRDRITGAGVTSGIDFGFLLLSQLLDKKTAQMAQLMMEYKLESIYSEGIEGADGDPVLQEFNQMGQSMINAFWAQTRELVKS